MKQNDRHSMRTRSVRILAAIAAAGTSLLLSDTLEAAGAAPEPNICSRACWNARGPKSIPSTMAALNRAVIHHTASTYDYTTTSLNGSKSRVRGIQNYHMDVNGWIDIGYHFLVDKLGNTFAGRYNAILKSQRPRGAHDGTNTNSFGYNVMGYYHPPYNNAFTTASRNALWDVIAWRMPNGWSPYGSGSYAGKTVGRVAGHRNVKATACPGDGVYALIGTNYSGGTARNAINARINPTVSSVTVDNHQSGFSASANWATTTLSGQNLGSNYRWRSTTAVSDAATWTGNLPTSGAWRVDAWWIEGANRSLEAPYIVHHNGGSSVVKRNQQQNGGQWNSLGTFNFGSGNQDVQLSCWAPSGYVVIADGVRWVKQ